MKRLYTVVVALGLIAAGVKAAPVPPATRQGTVRITAMFGTAHITGTVEDAAVTCAATSYRLSQLQSIDLHPPVQVHTADGKYLRGEIKGLDAIRLDVNGAVGPIDLSKADSILISVVSVEATAAPRPLRQLPKSPTAATHDAPTAVRGSPPPAATDPPVGEMAVSSEIRLPCPVMDAVTAADGKYLILLLRDANELAVCDFEQSKIVKYLPIPTSPVVIAAGLDKLIVLVSQQQLIQKWDLRTFTREKVAPLVLQGQAISAAMGAASDGPVLVLRRARTPIEPFPFELIDRTTLQLLPKPSLDQLFGVQFSTGHTALRASRHDELFTFSTADGQADGVLRLGDGKVSYRRVENYSDYIAPGPDAETLFTGLHGLANSEGVKLAEGPPVVPGTQVVGNCIPASVPGLYLNLRYRPEFAPPPGMKPQELFLYVQGRHRPSIQLPALGELPSKPRPRSGDDAMALDKRIFFRPELKKLLTVPETRNAIVVHEFDVFERLRHSEDDQYLLVSSTPPPVTRFGQTYRYPIRVESKAGGFSFEWVSGPPGWSVSNAGVVSGRVRGSVAAPARVVIRIKDKESNEFTYAFGILVRR